MRFELTAVALASLIAASVGASPLSCFELFSPKPTGLAVLRGAVTRARTNLDSRRALPELGASIIDLRVEAQNEKDAAVSERVRLKQVPHFLEARAKVRANLKDAWAQSTDGLSREDQNEILDFVSPEGFLFTELYTGFLDFYVNKSYWSRFAMNSNYTLKKAPSDFERLSQGGDSAELTRIARSISVSMKEDASTVAANLQRLLKLRLGLGEIVGAFDSAYEPTYGGSLWKNGYVSLRDWLLEKKALSGSSKQDIEKLKTISERLEKDKLYRQAFATALSAVTEALAFRADEDVHSAIYRGSVYALKRDDYKLLDTIKPMVETSISALRGVTRSSMSISRAHEHAKVQDLLNSGLSLRSFNEDIVNQRLTQAVSEPDQILKRFDARWMNDSFTFIRRATYRLTKPLTTTDRERVEAAIGHQAQQVAMAHSFLNDFHSKVSEVEESLSAAMEFAKLKRSQAPNAAKVGDWDHVIYKIGILALQLRYTETGAASLHAAVEEIESRFSQLDLALWSERLPYMASLPREQAALMIEQMKTTLQQDDPMGRWIGQLPAPSAHAPDVDEDPLF